ncbi:hypothetical protein ACHWQZ_G014700 [Mnemiopsis leidyi]
MTDFSLDETALPMANAFNKQIENQVKEKDNVLFTMDGDIKEKRARVEAMSEHMKNVQQELTITQNLVAARLKEIESENHLRMLAEREQGRFNLLTQRKKVEINEIKDRQNTHENNMFRYTQKIEQIKQQMKWSQKELEDWLEEASHRDEDAMTLMKYAKIDDAKIKELTLRLEKLTEERGKKKKLLENEVTSTLTTQIELDKTAEAFRQAHDERMEVLEQWENIILQMQRRDEEMEHGAGELRSLKHQIKVTENQMSEKQQFLENEQQNNHEKEKVVDVAERQVAKIRLEYQDAENSRIQFRDELETLKYCTERTNSDLEVRRTEVNHLKKEIKSKEEKLSSVKRGVEEAKEALDRTLDSTLTAEQRAIAADQFLDKEELWVREIAKEIRRLREQQFKKNEVLQHLKTRASNKQAEIHGSQAASKNLSSKLNKIDQEALKQHEIIYNQDFQLQVLERKVARLQGERSDEEREALAEKIKLLNQQYENLADTKVFLEDQMKKLNDDLRRGERELSKSTGEKDYLATKIDELNLHNDSSQRSLKKMTSEKDDLMVEHNILKLELKRLRQTLNQHADGVLNLNKRRLQLQKAMDERKIDIGIHTDMLQQQIKHAEGEKSKISAELHERCAQIDKLRKRYEILMTTMAPPEGEEEHSAAYYVIAAAQEKEGLQREGDQLDANIRKAEKEIHALENTIKVMNARNTMYRSNFTKVDQTSEDLDQERALEEQRRAVMDKYKYKRRQVRELQEDLDAMSRTYDNLAAEEGTLGSQVGESEGRVEGAKKQLTDQQAKLDRVSKQLVRYGREIRATKGKKNQTMEEDDITLRDMATFNKDIASKLVSSIQSYPEAYSTLTNLLYQASIPIPTSLPASRSQSRAGSSTSSLISARSDKSAMSLGITSPTFNVRGKE